MGVGRGGTGRERVGPGDHGRASRRGRAGHDGESGESDGIRDELDFGWRTFQVRRLMAMAFRADAGCLGVFNEGKENDRR